MSYTLNSLNAGYIGFRASGGKLLKEVTKGLYRGLLLQGVLGM